MVAGMVSRLVGAGVLGLVGWWLGGTSASFLPWGIVGAVAGIAAGAVATPYVVISPLRKALALVERAPGSTLFATVAGLVVGLILAVLISVPISRISGWPGVWVPVALSVILSCMGIAVALKREPELVAFIPEAVLGRGRPGGGSGGGRQILMDTSAIIDGRIADITQAGFVYGTLVVPSFVLDELQHIADSGDSLRRNRGRRGLEMLNKLRKESDVSIQVLDTDGRDGTEVDGKLVTLAKRLGAPIVTTDFNLNRVAELQGVRVLNINELANALKPVVLPGEEMPVRIIQEGKEVGQGIAFLDDGTMVVVEGGRRYINQNIDVQVTRMLQTAAGRIIFSQPKA